MGLLNLGVDNIARDATGSPAPSAMRSVFLAGTDTLAPIYDSRHLKRMQQNPMEADAVGAFPDAYLTDGTYRIEDEDRHGFHAVIREGHMIADSAADDFPVFDSAPALLADTALTAMSGDFVSVTDGDLTYLVADGAASDHHVTTAGGVKLYVLPKCGKLCDQAFGVVGDGATDDTVAIKALRDVAEAGPYAIQFRPLTYLYTEPLSFSGVDVDFNGAALHYDGPTGEFALTLNSTSGSGTTQTRGNRYSDFTLFQEDFAEFDTYTGSATFDPGGVPADSNLTAITPGGVSTTLTVTGAREGGFARATFSALLDGIEVTAWVSADDEVTVHFSNYTSSAIDMASGTIDVTVVNNAYHGLCIGGSLGKLEGAKVRGFTGVSVGVGAERCQISGVDFAATQEAYYWDADLNVNPAAGWGFVCQPRNNENAFGLSFFPADFYGDQRSNCFSQAVVSGVANRFRRMSLECNSSEEILILTESANTIEVEGVVYHEDNPSFPASPAPRITARRHSSGNRMKVRMHGGRTLNDLGMGNDIRRVPTYYLNPQLETPVAGSRNLVVNGEFENGIQGWSNWTNGTPTLTIPGEGKLSGQRVRIDVIDGRPNLQQELHQVGDYSMAGLDGHTLTFGAWVKTDLPDIVVRADGVAGLPHPADDAWHFLTSTIRPDDTISISLSIIKSSSATVTGYVEISGVIGGIGMEVPSMAERGFISGSKSHNPASVAAGAWGSVTTIDVPGAAPGDVVLGVSHSHGGGLIWPGAAVSSTDTVSVAPFNPTGGAVDLGSGTLTCLVRKM